MSARFGDPAPSDPASSHEPSATPTGSFHPTNRLAGTSVARATISVVIPCHNAASFIAEAVRSALEQTRRPLEVIVVDDGSRDGSADAARAAGASMVLTQRNRGPCAARNAALRLARGEYVAFLDADDAYEPAHLEVVGGALDGCGSADVAFARCRPFGREGAPEPPPRPAGVPLDMRTELLLRNRVAWGTVVARRRALEAVGGFDESRRLAGDYDLLLRLAEGGARMIYVHQATVRYREHPHQISRAVLSVVRAAWQVRLDAYGRGSASASRVRRAWRGELWRALRRNDAQLLELTLSIEAPRVALERLLYRAARRPLLALRALWSARRSPSASNGNEVATGAARDGDA